MTSSTPTPPPSSPSSGGGEIIYPQQPPKDPVLILVLNLLLLGGVGYIIIGQKMKGIAAIVLWLLGLFTCGIGSGIVAIVGAIDGWMQAQELQKGNPVGQWTFFQDHK
jgi:TM2 domain-containing membrane protein YozV